MILSGRRVPPRGSDQFLHISTVVTLVTVIGMTPMFLIAASASLIRIDIELAHSQVGWVATAFFGSALVTSLVVGGVIERLDGRVSVLTGLGIAAIALGVGALATETWHLLTVAASGGVANGVLQPATNLILARRIDPRRRGVAFGIKQSAIPMSTLVAGVTLPLVAATIGWRWSFVAICAVAVPIGFVTWRVLVPAVDYAPQETASPTGTLERSAVRKLIVVAIIGGLGGAAANSLAAFYVESIVEAGMTVALAGSLLTAGSLIGVLARIASGWAVDRWHASPMTGAGWMMLAGAIGLFIVGQSEGLAQLVAGTALAFGAGWGWPALYHLGTVHENMDAPARATGIAQTGPYLGGMLGPAAFGYIASSAGFRTAWSLAAGVMAVGGLALWVVVGRRLR